MSFLTDQNKKVRISIPGPAQPVNNANVDSAMALIVQKQVFVYPQGTPVKQISADLVATSSSSVG